MEVRLTEAKDWALLKQVRLAALADTPTAFGVSYETAARYTDEQWRERASAAAGPEFWLAFIDGEAVGMIGGGISQTQRYNLIGMWVEPRVRGSGIASSLVEVVKSRALQKGHGRVFLDVSPDNERAAKFYRKHGFVFIDEYEPLASHPHIRVQTMVWNVNDDGICTHHQRRSDPEQYGVNAACLEGISPFDFEEVPVKEGRTHPKDKGAGGGPDVVGYLRYFPNTAR